MARVAREDIFPHAAPSATREWTGTRQGNWTSGYWAGLLWYEAALSGRAQDADTATAWTLRLAPHLDRKTHDIGFVFSSSAVLGFEIGQVVACRDLALRAAEALAGMDHQAAGVIPTGSQAEIAAGLDDVTNDCMVNLPLLWWAWKATGEERFLRVAVSHADRTARWHVKPNGRIVQSVHFHPETGEAVREETHQESGTQGCWTRGQAWGVYGFAEAHRATGDVRFLELAERAAEYYFARADANLVPFYCFDDPAIPDVPRDSSAAAIARRTMREIQDGQLVNLGYGVPALIPALGFGRRLHERVAFSIEHGPVGGLPDGMATFGPSANPDLLIDSASVFDLYDGGLLDVTALGLTQADRHGKVNVSRFAHMAPGSGGFCNICHQTRRILFCGTFTAGGLETEVVNGQVVIRRESKLKKFVSQADMSAGIEAARWRLRHAAWLKNQGRPIIREAAEAKMYQIWEGTSEIQRMVMGRQLLKEY